MKSVSVITNYNIPEKAELAAEVVKKFQQCGVRVCVPFYACNILRLPSLTCLPNNKLYDNAELIAVVGGDGTILETARRSADKGAPILGINKGRVGYMAELEPDELDLIRRVVDGEYRIENRSMLDVEVYAGERMLYVSRALNDAVVCNGTASRMIDVQLLVDGGNVGTYRADGMIVSTPTGSTAYSLSAGGPLIDPRLKGTCVTPICAHSFAARSMVFPEEAVIELRNVSARLPYITLTVDGRVNIHIGKNNAVKITHSEKYASLVRVKENNYFTDLYSKLKNV
ncbi:MAG: NAD(+)/NADH kinase [Clostridia bacterium]|nr:NAD(+)/NADH kinase [Clostridia bacterium]